MEMVGLAVSGTVSSPWQSSQLSEGTEVSFLDRAFAALEVGVRRVHLIGDVVAGSEKARSPSGFLA